MAAAPGGGGYREAASDGGVFAQGSAPLVGSDWGSFTFGDAQFNGSTGGQALVSKFVGIAG
jgi:hypothetical protein